MGTPSAPIADFYAVVPAGGAGTRLWPLSRRDAPKFLLDLTGSGRSLLQGTVDRLVPLAGEDGVVLVTGERHVAAARTQLPGLSDDAVLAEPSPRDSMAAIGLAAAVLQERHGDVVIGSFAADQVISGTDAFEQAVREAVEAAREGYVVTIGIAASRPSTAFGYVRSGESLGVLSAPTALHAQGFTEKPDADTARAYLATGQYRWNAGMFIVRTSVLLDHLARERPALHDGLRTIAAAWDSPARDEVVAATWPGLERIAIDHAVAEPVAALGGVAVVPGTFGWDDVGDFNSLAALLPSVDGAGSKVLGDGADVVRIDSAGSVVVPGDRVVAVLGLDDVVVVDTPDALLVTTRARAQKVKQMVDALHDLGLDELL
ncbi:mannose-1-phosphate guanylyltransferase [Sediminihabitans luteus]|uniref:Mannose-1-phosphate guanylyltransferase n=1 Tax=Sediminihabitans luteus TaxID=1138585 RepID=A0A2M9CYG9_9CELL|nr:mannose-1-phosphate guanylyltransferase [Sediminihabitans luteus]PJJ76981.1 mannose-1-phosphate guanylyltransferase [Sediminihabitans luteus]GII99622.1 mannose-1-phosphate guanyltransferase [Sediminihabitans luteus]